MFQHAYIWYIYIYISYLAGCTEIYYWVCPTRSVEDILAKLYLLFLSFTTFHIPGNHHNNSYKFYIMTTKHYFLYCLLLTSNMNGFWSCSISSDLNNCLVQIVSTSHTGKKINNNLNIWNLSQSFIFSYNYFSWL